MCGKAVFDISDAERKEYAPDGGNGFTLPYRLLLPKDAVIKPPLLFYLHGFGECGTDNEKQLGVLGGRNKLLDELAARGDCAILAPQCRGVPPEYAWVDIGNKWSTGSRDSLGEPTVSLRAAAALLSEYISSGDFDADRVYIVGLSMGGYGAWEMIARYPGLFAAAVPVCGAGFPGLADRIKHIPVWAFHGVLDDTVPVSGTRDMETALNAVGGNVRAVYLEGYSHSIWDPAFGTPGLTEWLLSQRRKT